MGNPALGTKCSCAQCHERFYDLNRSPVICPKCGAEQPPEKARVSRPPRSTLGIGFRQRRPPAEAVVEDDAEPAATSEAEADDEDDVADLDEEADDDVEIDADRRKTAD